MSDQCKVPGAFSSYAAAAAQIALKEVGTNKKYYVQGPPPSYGNRTSDCFFVAEYTFASQCAWGARASYFGEAEKCVQILMSQGKGSGSVEERCGKGGCSHTVKKS